jgi:hypothetical protein
MSTAYNLCTSVEIKRKVAANELRILASDHINTKNKISNYKRQPRHSLQSRGSTPQPGKYRSATEEET